VRGGSPLAAEFLRLTIEKLREPVLVSGTVSLEEFEQTVHALQDPSVVVVAPMTVAVWARRAWPAKQCAGWLMHDNNDPMAITGPSLASSTGCSRVATRGSGRANGTRPRDQGIMARPRWNDDGTSVRYECRVSGRLRYAGATRAGGRPARPARRHPGPSPAPRRTLVRSDDQVLDAAALIFDGLYEFHRRAILWGESRHDHQRPVRRGTASSRRGVSRAAVCSHGAAKNVPALRQTCPD
jgi:hypothetical protein